MDKFVLKTESDFWSGKLSFFLKIYYQREWKTEFSLYLFFFFNCSRLEEEKKNVGKEENEKAETEKVKREAVQVTVSGPWSLMTPYSLWARKRETPCTSFFMVSLTNYQKLTGLNLTNF